MLGIASKSGYIYYLNFGKCFHKVCNFFVGFIFSLGGFTFLHFIIGCRSAFSETLRKMYSIKHDLTSLPPMPLDGDTWSVMNSWVLPTKSFMEFVMFSRFEN